MNDLVRKEMPVRWADKHYLVVDDYAGIRRLLREHLRGLGAVHIDLAASGGEAVALLMRTRYDVVLCDYHLGEGKNGQQVLEEARMRNLLMPSSMWLMVSAEKSVESVIGAAEHQPDAYVIKPITEGVLLTRLNRIWQKKQVFREIDLAYADKDYRSAARLCEGQIVNNKVHEIDLMRMEAKLFVKCGEPGKAREVYQRILVERDYPWAMVGLAKIRMGEGDIEAARDTFQEVINENRFYLDAYDQLALAHIRLGNSADACKVLERAAMVSPNSIARQNSLGSICFKLGNLGMAEKAFRKCIAIGANSALRSPDAFFGLARVLGAKAQVDEALALLHTVQREFPTDMTGLRATIAEATVYHESSDYRRARKTSDALANMLDRSPERPDTRTCIDMATLLFAVGVKEAPVNLLCYLVKNNHDDTALHEEILQLFIHARMGDEGKRRIAEARKEATEIMNKGVLLWRTGKLDEAIAWTRTARQALPNSLRILFNAAQIIISCIQQKGYDASLAAEANEVLMHVDAVSPFQQRFAILMEQLAALAPAAGDGKDGQAPSDRGAARS